MYPLKVILILKKCEKKQITSIIIGSLKKYKYK